MRLIHAALSYFQIVRELLASLWHFKRWWAAPLVLALIVLGLLLLFGSASGVAPFIYTLF